MGNFMKNVWTDSQGTIHRPEPGSSRVWLSNPTRRFSLVSATSTDSPRTVWRVSFRTRTFNFVGYHGEGDECCGWWRGLVRTPLPDSRRKWDTGPPTGEVVPRSEERRVGKEW